MLCIEIISSVIKYYNNVQWEWNEIQSWSQPQPLINQDYDHIKMVVMRFTHMFMRVGKQECYDANEMWHGIKTYCYEVQPNVHKIYHILKIYQLNMIPIDHETNWF